MGSQGGEGMWQGGTWRTQVGEGAAGRSGSPNLHVDKPVGTTGERESLHPRVPVRGNKASKPRAIKTCGVEAVGEIPSLTAEFVAETHRVLERTQTHPPGNQHQEDPTHVWVKEEVTECQPRA